MCLSKPTNTQITINENYSIYVKKTLLININATTIQLKQKYVLLHNKSTKMYKLK